MAIILPLLAVIAIVYPIVLRRGERYQAFANASHLQDLLDQRETLLQGLHELENDRALGNLGESEYQRLRDDYERQAAAVIKALDQRANGLSAELEAELDAAKLRTHGDASPLAKLPPLEGDAK